MITCSQFKFTNPITIIATKNVDVSLQTMSEIWEMEIFQTRHLEYQPISASSKENCKTFVKMASLTHYLV